MCAVEQWCLFLPLSSGACVCHHQHRLTHVLYLNRKHFVTCRRTGSFIYEEFLTTGGTDVKVYTVGPRCVRPSPLFSWMQSHKCAVVPTHTSHLLFHTIFFYLL